MHKIVTAALVREGRVLLVHRSPNRPAYPDVWDLPGGHIEAGETELAALAREMDEELGVRIATDSAIHLCRLEAGHGEESVRFSAWLVSEWEGTPTNVAPDEHDEIRWFRPEEIPPLAHDLMGPAVVEAMRGPAPERQRATASVRAILDPAAHREPDLRQWEGTPTNVAPEQHYPP